MRFVKLAELEQVAEELGIDVVGAAPAEPYVQTEEHIRERRARGLFADMRFTMARPEVSCHPEALLPNAKTVVSAALCYYAEEPERSAGDGRLPRYTWFHAYAELREKLDALGRRLGGDYRVLVDENDHVDREGAARSGVGFYGKNTMLITRRHGSWVVLGTLVTDAEIERSHRSRSTAARAGSASTPVPPGRSTSPARSTRPAASPTGARRPARSRRSTAKSSAPRCTAATSARTSARGTAASRIAARDRPHRPVPSRTSRSSSGSKPPTRSYATATSASTSRETIRATCAETLSSRPAT